MLEYDDRKDKRLQRFHELKDAMLDEVVQFKLDRAEVDEKFITSDSDADLVEFVR